MKLSFVVPAPEKGESLNEFYRRLKLLKELGYDGVELAVRDPREIEEEKIRTLITALGLEVSAVATGRAENFAYFLDQMLFASRCGAKVIIGLIRKEIPKNDLSQILRYYQKIAQVKGLELLLEPINRYEIDFIHTLKEGVDFIKEANLRKIRILADTFHMNIEERSIYESLKEYGSFISHVHVADSNRLAPGQGHLGFPSILQILKAKGYRGFLSVELVPVKPDFEIAARQSIEYLRNIIKRI